MCDGHVMLRWFDEQFIFVSIVCNVDIVGGGNCFVKPNQK